MTEMHFGKVEIKDKMPTPIEEWYIMLEKIQDHGEVFGYLFTPPRWADGPREKLINLMEIMDKSIEDKVDYVADYLGYDPEEIKREIAEYENMLL